MAAGEPATLTPAGPSPVRLSANLGLLWTDRPLPERIRAAAAAGFDAVECHFPYDTDPREVARALRETRLPMIALNTAPGALAAGDFGLAALPGRTPEARAEISRAFDYAAAVDARCVHVMAGKGSGLPGAEAAFRDALGFAAERAERDGRMVLIEPLNRRDVPGYLFHRVEDAAEHVAALGSPRVRIMFDCYHQQIEGGDLLTRFAALRDLVGHVQFAGVPGRGAPDTGEVNYRWLLPAMAAAGHDGWFGAEYRPGASTDESLGWMAMFRAGRRLRPGEG